MASGKRRRLRFVGPIGGGLLAGAVGIAAYTAGQLNGPQRRTWINDFTFTPWELQVPAEAVSFRADDGVTLRGWWLPKPAGERVVIGCTGHKGWKHELLGIGSGLWRAGNNVLLFDFRGCGESDLSPLSVGYHEQRDALAAVRFARERVAGARIGLIGYSMGAVVSMLTAAVEPAVRAVVADSGYAALDGVIAAAYRRRRVPVRPLVALADRYNGWRYGYRFAALRPVEVVGQIAPRPLLIIHGDRDSVTPVGDAHALFAAAGEGKELWIVPGAPHCGAYFADRRVYLSRVADFFAQGLGG